MLGHGMTSGFLMRLRWDPRTSRRRNRDVEGGSNFRTNRSSNKAKAITLPQRLGTIQQTERGRGSSNGGTILFCQPSPAVAQPHSHGHSSTASAMPVPLPSRQRRLPQRSVASCLPRYVACATTGLPSLDARPYGTPRLGTTARTDQLRSALPATYWRCPPEPLTKGNNHVDYAQRLVPEPAGQSCLPACTVQAC